VSHDHSEIILNADLMLLSLLLKTVALLINISIHDLHQRFSLLSVLISEGQTEPHPPGQTQSSGARQLFDSGGGLLGFYCHGVGDVRDSELLAPPLPP